VIIRKEIVPWAGMQELQSSAGMINPFNGLFHALQWTIQSGSVVTCSKHKSGAASEEKTEEGLLCGHEYGVVGLHELTDSKGAVHRVIQTKNPHGHGEWNGRYSDFDSIWKDPLMKQHRLNKLKMEASVVDDGLTVMSFKDFRREFTKCDVSAACSNSDDHEMLVKQVTGMITEECCGGEREWHRNPKFHMSFKQATTVTITLNQPNTKIIGFDEDYQTAIGFRIIMVLKTDHVNTVRQREVIDDATVGDHALMAKLSAATVPDKVSHFDEVLLCISDL